jgi:hypothetical protein
MSRKPSRKPKPPPNPRVAVATKKGAAIGQLESAILLWFSEADPISILVLASNAHDCFHAIGTKIGKPSEWMIWLQSFPKSFQERANYIQDYAKHGFKDLDENAPFDPMVAEMVMVAAIDCHEKIYGNGTPLMALFLSRFFFENPQFARVEKRDLYLAGSKIEGLGNGSRKGFFDKYFGRAVMLPPGQIESN